MVVNKMISRLIQVWNNYEQNNFVLTDTFLAIKSL